jgi:hypothetical protein
LPLPVALKNTTKNAVNQSQNSWVCETDNPVNVSIGLHGQSQIQNDVVGGERYWPGLGVKGAEGKRDGCSDSIGKCFY